MDDDKHYGEYLPGHGPSNNNLDIPIVKDNKSKINEIALDVLNKSINKYLTGHYCPYCDNKTDYIDSSYIYGKSYGMIYICKTCDAYVGVHKETNKSLGRLANKELREAKKDAHSYFDKISRTRLINEIYPIWFPGMSNRNKAYKWLSIQMNIPKSLCHIGMFDIDQCNQVINI